MTAHPQQNPGRRKIIVLLTVLLGISLLVILNRSVNPGSSGEEAEPAAAEPTASAAPAPDKTLPHEDIMRNPQAARDYMDALVKKTGGNFERLSVKDKAWVDSLTNGHGAQMFRSRAETLRSQPSRRQNNNSGKE